MLGVDAPNVLFAQQQRTIRDRERLDRPIGRDYGELVAHRKFHSPNI
jgi:hypothetical protein